MEIEEPAEGEAAEHAEVGPMRQQRAPDRHVLVPGLEGGGAAQQEDLRRRAVVVAVPGPVVVDLVVVEGGDPRRGRMRRLQVAVDLVLGVAVAVVDQRVDLVAPVQPRPRDVRAGLAAFVDVVAIVEDEVEPLGRKMAKGGKQPLLVVLAAGDREAEPLDRRARRRRGAGAAGRTPFLADLEAIPIVTAGLEPVDLDMDRVGELRPRRLGSFPHHSAEAIVGCQFPGDLDRLHRHAAAFERFRRDPRPQHHAVRPRIAGGDAEAEGVAPEDRVGQGRQGCEADAGSHGAEQETAIDATHGHL